MTSTIHLPSWLRPGQSLLLLVCVLLISPHLHLCQAQNMQAGCTRNSPEECIADEEWFNPDTGCCQTCSACTGHSQMYPLAKCNKTHDTVCDCRSPTFLDTSVNSCFLSCGLCPSGECTSPAATACKCDIQECHMSDDIYCRRPHLPPCVPIISPTTPAGTRPPSVLDGQDSLPAWGIGLIAVGIVIGIITFASCFLCLGIFTMHKTHDPESQQGSETSENGLVPRGSVGSIGTNSTYPSSTVYPYLSSHSMLELLKHSNSQLVSANERLSSLQSSPVSSRSSPKPGRTVKLAKCANSDKLTAIML